MNEIALTLLLPLLPIPLLYWDHFVEDSTSAITSVDSFLPSTENPHQQFLSSLSQSSQVYITNLEILFILLLLGQYPRKSFGLRVCWSRYTCLSVVWRTSVLIFMATGEKIPFLTGCLTLYFTLFTILTNSEYFQIQTKHLICYSFRRADI